MKSGRLKFITAVATLGPVGHLPLAPGTWGSAVAVAAWWLLAAERSQTFNLTVALLVALLSVVVSGLAERRLGRDARPIVIDEVAGQWLALAAASKSVTQAVGAFLLFRLFDVWKPFPIRVSQKLPGGVGVTIDDLLAGIYTALIITVIRHYRLG